jgi:hypothetical protein
MFHYFQGGGCSDFPVRQNKLSADAAFIHPNGTYIITDSKQFYEYALVKDMCSGQPIRTGLFEEIVEYFDSPDLLASILNGTMLVVFKGMHLLQHGIVDNVTL